MKKLISIGLPLLLAALILAAGALLPQAAFHRQRQDYLNQTQSVPVEEVQPYGEEYEERKNKLLTSIRLLWDIENGGKGEILPVVDADREITQRYRDGLNRMWDFFALLEEYIPGFDSGSVKNYPAEEKNWIYAPGDMDNALGQISMLQEEYGVCNMICFDLDTGLPLYMDLYLMAEEGTADSSILWDGLLAAYEKVSGITFSSQPTVVDQAGSITQFTTGNEAGYISIKDPLYEQVQLEAVSADSAFHLIAEYYRHEDEIALQIGLVENGQN